MCFILPIFIFTVASWNNKKSWVIKKISDTLGNGPWIVRSSFSGEDELEKSNAGAFVSVLNVDSETLEGSIDNVIASYSNESLAEEVLVQPMIKNVELTGVAFLSLIHI